MKSLSKEQPLHEENAEGVHGEAEADQDYIEATGADRPQQVNQGPVAFPVVSGQSMI